jgi:hypothetical protein
MDSFHDGCENSFLDLLERWIFRVLVRSGNSITAAFFNAVAYYYVVFWFHIIV